MDQVLDSLGKGRVFSLFDLVSSFHQITAHKDIVPLTAFSTPTGLCKWLVIPQGSSVLPGWFVKVINEVIKGLAQVAAYLDDVIVFDSDPAAYVKTIRALFERLRKHNLKLSPSKARLGATDANFLGHSTSPAGIRPNAKQKSDLMKLPMPKNLKRVRALMGGVGYYRKFLPNLSKRIRPLTALLRKGVKYVFTPAMEVIVRQILDEMFWIACSQLVRHPSRASKNASLVFGGFGESAPLQTSTSVRLSNQFFRENEPTCSPAVWACVVPP